MEGDLVGVGVQTCRIIGARLMKEKKVEDSQGEDDEGEEEMECEESGKSGVVDGKSTPDSLNESVTYVGDSREKVGNYGSPSKRHLSSGEYVAYKGGYHNEEKKKDPNISGLLIKV